MVISESGKEESMGGIPERTKPLHNFPMSTWLKWGNQRLLRCMKVNSETNNLSPISRQPIENFEALATNNEKEEEVEEGEGSGTKQWNLRTRRTPSKGQNGKINKLEEKKVVFNSAESTTPMKSLRLRGNSNNNGNDDNQKERVKFSISLSKREIEEDFLMMTGEKPPRRPKKRPKAVQKQVDMVSPGMWLREVTADMYKVSEVDENGKVKVKR